MNSGVIEARNTEQQFHIKFIKISYFCGGGWGWDVLESSWAVWNMAHGYDKRNYIRILYDIAWNIGMTMRYRLFLAAHQICGTYARSLPELTQQKILHEAYCAHIHGS